MLRKRTIKRCLNVALLMALFSCLGLRLLAAAANYPPLAEEQMRTITGGSGCTACRYAGERLDECYHLGWADECCIDLCIANYVIESTCDPGDGDCTAYPDWNATASVQYKRQDVDCYTENFWDWNYWYTHYYGVDCITVDGYSRCEKFYTACDGTLLDTSSQNDGIVCQ